MGRMDQINLFYDVERIPRETIIRFFNVVLDIGWKFDSAYPIRNNKNRETFLTQTNLTNYKALKVIENLDPAELDMLFMYEESQKISTAYSIHFYHRAIVRQEESDGRYYRYSRILILFRKKEGFDYCQELRVLCKKTNAMLGFFSLGDPMYDKELDRFIRGISSTYIPTGNAIYMNMQFYKEFGLEKRFFNNSKYLLNKNNKYIFALLDPLKL